MPNRPSLLLLVILVLSSSATSILILDSTRLQSNGDAPTSSSGGGGRWRIAGDSAAPIIPEIPLIIAAAAALPGLMGRSACALGKDSAAAAALDGLLAAGDGNSPGGKGSSSTADGIVRSNLWGVGVVCGGVLRLVLTLG